MKAKIPVVFPIFDSIEHTKNQTLSETYSPSFAMTDFEQAKSFLLTYSGNDATFIAYRRETERLLHWSWLIAKKSVRDLKRADIEEYM